jgi:hypothetical protein
MNVCGISGSSDIQSLLIIFNLKEDFMMFICITAVIRHNFSYIDKLIHHMKFEIFVVESIKITILLYVITCNLADKH